MENTLGHYAEITALAMALFFGLIAASGLVNLYLRHIDHLSIDRDDVNKIARSALYAVLLASAAALFHYLPFFMATGFLLVSVLLVQMIRINTLAKRIK